MSQARSARGEEGLARVAALKDGWHEPASRAPTVAALAAARKLIICPPWVIPLQSGGLQLEWHGGGVDCEIVILPDGSQEIE